MRASGWLISEECLVKNNVVQAGAFSFVQALIDMKAPFVILTNRSDQTRDELAIMFSNYGFRGMRSSHFYTSTMAGVDYLRYIHPRKNAAGYIGNNSMKLSLNEGGFAVNLNYADWVFVGTDQSAVFKDYAYMLRLLDDGAQIISTDMHPVQFTKNGPIPGVGSIVKMLETASGKKSLNVGFPSRHIVECALNYLGVYSQGAIFVGCDSEYDIKAGNDAGVRTVLIIPQQNEQNDLFNIETKPTYVVEDLMSMLR